MTKTLLLVDSHDAARLVDGVLERVPQVCWNNPAFHVLCIADSSRDPAAEPAASWLRAAGYRNASVLRILTSQGDGGIQKLGYRFALDMGFDYVVLIRGEDPHSPEHIPAFVTRYEATGADVVLGLRTPEVRGAVRRGVPHGTFGWNRLLARLQNLIFGQALADYYTGRRGYSSKFLASVPFEIDSNDSTFATEILLQALKIEGVFGIGVPFAAVLEARIGRWAGSVSDLLARIWPSLFAFQFSVLARPRPGVRQLLRQAEHCFAPERQELGS